MDELDGDGGRADSPPPLMLLPDDMLVHILLRLPPEPIHLFRASFVSKRWRRLVHDARFLRRFREFHGGAPPVLGLFNDKPELPLFVPIAGGFALSTDTMSHHDWRAMDCRHGRALLESLRSGTLLVWDLVTGDQRHLPFPPACEGASNGAVLCAAGHDHGDCHSCPFLVVYVLRPSDSAICACVWSSETGVWSEITSISFPSSSVGQKSSALVGNKLYWLLENGVIFEYDLDNHRLGLTKVFQAHSFYDRHIVIMPTEDGCLGLAGVEGLHLDLWSLMTNIDGLLTWKTQRVIDLEELLPPRVVAAGSYGVDVIGFAEDAGIIFIYVYPSVYMIHLKSMQIDEVPKRGTYGTVIPYTSFYAPGITTGGGDDQAEMLSNN